MSQGSLDRDTYNALNAVVAVSMLTTPLLLVLYDRFAGLQIAPPEEEAIEEENPVIVAGFGRFGQIAGAGDAYY